MSALIDMTGKRYGRLVALRSTSRGSAGMRWVFQCDCGQQREYFGYQVRVGRIVSCGCHAIDVHRGRIGELHSNWVGDDASYRTVHTRLARYRGAAKGHQCSNCGEKATDWAYDGADADQKVSASGLLYSTNLEHYAPLCRSCHVAFDDTTVKKLNADDITAIHEMHMSGWTQRAIAHTFGVAQGTVWGIINGKIWTSVEPPRGCPCHTMGAAS